MEEIEQQQADGQPAAAAAPTAAAPDTAPAAAAPATVAPVITNVALKLPAFWTKNPEAWFLQSEAQFGLRKISADETKYYHVIAALDTDTATRAARFMRNPPPNNKYEALKAFLVRAYSLSDSERTDRLLAITDIGDRKPSEAMYEMLRILGDHPPCLLFRQLFVRALPLHVQEVLATCDTEDMIRLAEEADKVIARSKGKQPAVCSTQQSDDDELPEVCRINQRQRRPQPLHTSGPCYFHRKFGANARKCESPCTWRPGNAKAGIAAHHQGHHFRTRIPRRHRSRSIRHPCNSDRPRTAAGAQRMPPSSRRKRFHHQNLRNHARSLGFRPTLILSSPHQS